MGIIDKAKEKISGNPDAAKSRVDQAGEKADEMTGRKYSDKIDKGTEKAKGGVESLHEHDEHGEHQGR